MKTLINKLFMAPVILLLLTIWGCGDATTVTSDAPQTSVAAAAADSNAKTVYAQTLVFGTNTIYTVPKSGALTVNQTFPGFYNGALGSLKIMNSTGANLVAPPPPVCTGKPGKVKDCLEKYNNKVLKPYNKKLALNPTSIQVLINGQEVVAAGSIPRTQGSATVAVAVNITNTLQVNLTGPKGSYIQLAITSENTPPLQNPIADFTYSPSTGSVPLSVLFDASISSSPNGSIVSYNWDFGDGSSDVSMNPFHTYYSAGTFAVTLTVVDSAGKSATRSVAIVANAPLPINVAFTYTVDTSTGAIIVNADANSSTSPNGPIITYMWDFGDGSGPFLGTATTSYVYAAPGTYTVTLTATDASGISGTTSQTITVP